MSHVATPRSTSPPRIFPLRLTSLKRGDRDSKTSDTFFSNRSGRFSMQSKASDKGKEPSRGGDIDSVTGNGNSETASVNTYLSSAPFTTYDRVRPIPENTMSTPSFNSRKNRASFLGAASDALTLRFGRKRPVIRQPQVPIILPDVIEISAPPPDQEVEERERLREMAAQAIGISPYTNQPDSHSQEESTEDEDEDALRTPADNSELRRFGNAANSASSPEFAHKPFVEPERSPTTPTPSMSTRFRSGSMVHARQNSSIFSPIPSFPTNVLSLNPFLASSGYIPKYTQPSSLRIFALSSKNWKSRYIILSSPATFVTKQQSPAVSYLHIFKSSGPDEKELERLEINEDSVVFVAEEEVGGRRNVIKVGGLEIALGKKEGAEDGGRTMWHLHIPDTAESQKWISSIKNVILGQRTVRAGLGVPLTPIGYEPRGDLDVMLSIRAQGLASPLKSSPPPASDLPPPKHSERNYASSVSSHSVRSQATVPKSPSNSGAVSAFKGFFSSSSRPRSASRAASIESDRQQPEREQNEESFTSMGTSLLSMLRTNTPAPDNQSTTTSPSSPVPLRNNLPFAPSSTILERRQETRALIERQRDKKPEPVQDQSNATSFRHRETRANRALSLGALSLQPPPRKRWTTIRPASPTSQEGDVGFRTRERAATVSTSEPRSSSFEIEPRTNPVDFLSLTGRSSYEERPRPASLQSVSTSENAASVDRSSVSTKHSSSTNRRWSRQVPQRLTPPSGPPPAIPTDASVTLLHAHPYSVDDRPPSTMSNYSTKSQKSMVSSLPSFKRASSSSTRSVTSSNITQTTHANGSMVHIPTSPHSPRHSAHRTSAPPPPRPAPTTALPPAPIAIPEPDSLPPTPSTIPTPPSTKTSFRTSVAQRALRLSVIAPKPPPSSNLPPRPDEPEYSRKSHHRRSSSSGKGNILDTISEPLKQSHVTPISPFPPPLGPLPPTPGIAGPSLGTSPPASRHSSLKQRLRILSAPSPTNTPPQSTTRLPNSMTPTTTPVMMHFNTHSTPSTPNAEKTSFMPSNLNDPPSFLQMNTPVLSTIQPSRLFESLNGGEANNASNELLDSVTALSPPPRRRSGTIVEVVTLPADTTPTPPVQAVSASVAAAANNESNDNELLDAVIPLLPPPRRRSATVVTLAETPEVTTPVKTSEAADDSTTGESHDSADAGDAEKNELPQPRRVFSLSPHGSVVSLKLVHT